MGILKLLVAVFILRTLILITGFRIVIPYFDDVYMVIFNAMFSAASWVAGKLAHITNPF